MITYVSAFIFYTLAMIGVLLIGFVIYKKTFLLNQTNCKGNIKIIDNLAIAPKKNLLIVQIKQEKFLIASGESHTTFLAKLECDKINQSELALAAALYNNQYNNQYNNNQSDNQFNKNDYLNTINTQNIIQMPNTQQNDTQTQNSFVINAEENALNNKTKNERIEQIHKQFQELYSQNNIADFEEAYARQLNPVDKLKNNKKRAVRKLLKDLNEATSNTQGGING